MNAVGIDVSKGKSMVAALRPMGEVALLPQEFLHTEVGLERSGADIGTEVFQSVVSCSMKGRFSYSVHYPDINRMKQKTVF